MSDRDDEMRTEFLRIVADGWNEAPSDCEPPIDLTALLAAHPARRPRSKPYLKIDNERGTP